MDMQTNDLAAGLDREFHGIIAKIASEPNAQERFDHLMRAWKRAQIVHGEPSTDATLSALWEEWKASALGIEQHRSDSAIGQVFSARFLAAREAIVRTTVTGPVGLTVKLRCALDGVVDDVWASQALYEGNDTTLIARAEELREEGTLILDAIGFLTRRGPDRTEWDQAMDSLEAAKATAKERDSRLSIEESDARTKVWTDAEDRLLDMPAPDITALAWKLEWLLHPETGSSPQQFGGAQILADVHRLAGRPVVSFEEPTKAPVSETPPLEQMEQWLGHLVADGDAYAKLWLRLVDSSELSAAVEADDRGGEVLLLASRHDDPAPKHLALSRALRTHLRSSDHQAAVIQHLKAKGRYFERRPAEAA